MPNNAELERLLDKALPGYVAKEPGADLERRILAGIPRAGAGVQTPSWGLWVRWSAAVAAAACLLVGLLLFLSHSRRPAMQQAVQPRTGAPDSQRQVSSQREAGAEMPSGKKPGHAVSSGTNRWTVARARPLLVAPKLSVFPSPAPLTSEEQALLTFAAKAPKDQQQALIASESTAIEPIRIAAIHIDPLPLDGDSQH